MTSSTETLDSLIVLYQDGLPARESIEQFDALAAETRQFRNLARELGLISRGFQFTLDRYIAVTDTAGLPACTISQEARHKLRRAHQLIREKTEPLDLPGLSLIWGNAAVALCDDSADVRSFHRSGGNWAYATRFGLEKIAAQQSARRP